MAEKKVPGPRWPLAAERLLARELLRVARQSNVLTRRQFETVIRPLLETIAAGQPLERLRPQLQQALATLGLRLVGTFHEAIATALALRAIRRVQIFVALDLRRQARAAGITVNPLLSSRRLNRAVASRVRETVQYIKSIPERHHRLVERAVLRGIREGQMTETIGKRIQEIGAITARRGRLIARDQIAKGLSALNEAQQRDLGLTRFRWVSAQDERVRPGHRQLHGRVFSWAEGAPRHLSETGYPGRDILCRCQAMVVKGDLLVKGRP